MADPPPVSPQVFQRREDGSVNFFRGWEAYRDGFGKLTGEHWLGAWGGSPFGAGFPPHRADPKPPNAAWPWGGGHTTRGEAAKGQQQAGKLRARPWQAEQGLGGSCCVPPRAPFLGDPPRVPPAHPVPPPPQG